MDSDPTPGDPEEVRELAEELQTFSDDVAEALGKIRGLASDRAVQDWAGLSAEAFRSEFDGVPGNLEKLRDSYDLCAQALQTYWPKLQTAQGQADRALDRAIAAQADLTSAQGALGDAQGWVSRAGEEAERLQREGERAGAPPPDEAEVRAATRDRQAADEAQEAAQARVDTAQDSLDAARELARQAKEIREEAARQAARDIDEASDAGIQNRKWWQDAVHWVTENWDTIVNVCKVIVAVLGVVVMIIGGPLAWVVLAAALVVLTDTLIKYARGEAGLLDVAFATLDCIPGMKGLTTLGGLARGLRGGLTAARTGLHGLAQGARGLGQGLRSMGRTIRSLITRGDPIDMATGEMVLSAVDVELPGVLPLILERHHRTSVQAGRLFGRAWASTLDQRLVLRENGIDFCAEDGMLLSYPRPIPGEPVLPVEGPRWTLTWDGRPESPLALHQPETGHTLHFAPIPGRRGGELPLVSLTDRNDNRLTVHYDGAGDPSALVHSGGYRLGITTEAGRVTELRLLSDPGRPVLVRYGYDSSGLLAEVINSSGMPLKLSYDNRHRLIRWEDRNGYWYSYAYDAEGRCVFTTGTDRVLEYRYRYDPENRRTHAVNSLGQEAVYHFNDSFQLIAETDPLGHSSAREWDRYDRLLSLTDPLGRTTRHTYDDSGRRTSVTRPDGRTIRVRYNELGLTSEVVQADSSVWAYAYDGSGNRTAVRDPAGGTTRFAYDRHGALTAVTDAAGNMARIRCDGAGLPVAFTDALGRTTEYRRDAFGRTVGITDPLGSVHRAEFTVEGRMSSRTDPLGGVQRWTYDAEGNCLSHTDANGATTRHEYGPFDLPVATTGPDGVRHSLVRDTELHLTRVVGPEGRAWDYTYDAAGRLTAESDFHGRAFTYRLDPAGQLVGRTNAAGQTVTYTLDQLGRPVELDADGRITSLTYDHLGQLLTATAPGSELVVERDPSGRLLSETVNGRTVSYTYDLLNRPVSRTTPSGHISTWSYDAAGHPGTLESAGRTLSFTHDAAGHVTRRAYSSGVTVDQAWDPAGRLTSLAVTGPAEGIPERRTYAYRAEGVPTSVGGVRFSLDARGRVTGCTDQWTGSWEESYAYDPLGRLVDADWPDAGDAGGERVHADGLITRAGRYRYEYDSAGRMVLRQKGRLSKKPATWRYEWDAQDRLTALTTPDGVRWRYLYDPFGRRLAKQRLADDGAVAEETTFTWSGTTLVEEAGPRVTRTWDHDGRVPLAQVEQDEFDRRFYAIVTDLVGTPTQLVDEDGRTAWRSRSTVWGLTSAEPGSTADTPLRFPGQYHDSESGLHYNYQRYYDPGIARYLTLDPLGLGPAPDPGGYVANPLIFSDPLGLAAHDDLVVLYHGASDFRGTVFQLGAPTGVTVRGATPQPGLYLTDDLTRAVQQYAGVGGRVVRVEVPRDFADRIRQMGGPPGNRQPEWFVDNAADLAQVNNGIIGIRDSMDAFMSWMNRGPGQAPESRL
ncbi:DUF6531 domain-containing protein [Streptomyces sp. MS19]|uniref:DUF6531 domain-containing protein n=1 Tax=Streptomyces sp. MS19 TaxID=3385972 RepID=UPI0039A3E11B